MKILIVSDAWLPQINGVVRTLLTTRQFLETMGHQVLMVTPDLFKTIPCPTYPEIRLALRPTKKIEQLVQEFDPDTIHIATEGPLGLAARLFCARQRKRFTTSFHTKFPEYVHARFGIPTRWSYRLLRWFHGLSSRVMVATQSLRQELETQGFQNLAFWSRGVDIHLFRPQAKDFLNDVRPISLYVGRVAVEKNIEAFLKLKLAGTKYVVGHGPQLDLLKQQYPDVRFVGAKTGEELSRYYAAADVFVFPSRTDTFGLVLLESLASGTPVAAYPVPGPLDVIGESGAGCLDENLELAVQRALTIPAERCRYHAEQYSWQVCTQQFLENLCPIKKIS
ncbi:glycosyltransferase [Beggiatoa alba B18LD]|uniref:Glycosyltransferase n=1 Tax=Beggiatoa alba B18LD TaxID=395493 RepID=I3CGF3_9GAMM|nr:glycosyltransferase family 1 protein [Beggiatoa alba]EIJ42696.1 glycosyltransferase [Beggiatoa alba B18LD]